jgi:hypothetical protein
MYSLYYKGLRLGVTFEVKPLCVGDFASFAKLFAGFYFSRGIDWQSDFLSFQDKLLTFKTVATKF